MTLGLYETRARQRRRARWSAVKWFFLLIVMGAVAAFGYATGAQREQHSRASLIQEIGLLSDRVAAFDAERAKLQAELKAAREQTAQLEARYAADVPSGPLADILQLARAKLDEGVSADRIAFLLGGPELSAAEPGQTRNTSADEASSDADASAAVTLPAGSCESTPVSKRFIVTTPLSSAGENGYVRFVNGAITVTAEGLSAQTSDGRPEAWYDPEKPITLRFVERGGKVTEMTGLLPLRQVVATGNREFSFEVMPGARGFAQVTSWDCGVQ